LGGRKNNLGKKGVAKNILALARGIPESKKPEREVDAKEGSKKEGKGNERRGGGS